MHSAQNIVQMSEVATDEWPQIALDCEAARGGVDGEEPDTRFLREHVFDARGERLLGSGACAAFTAGDTRTSLAHAHKNCSRMVNKVAFKQGENP